MRCVVKKTGIQWPEEEDEEGGDWQGGRSGEIALTYNNFQTQVFCASPDEATVAPPIIKA